MAKKAIYANIAGVYYQVDQSTNIPTHIARMARNHSHLEYDQRSREMIAAIWLSGMDYTHLQSNRGLYQKMEADLREQKVTEIPKITDHYLVYVDYAIYNEEGQEINHSCSTKRIEATDALLPLGVAFNNECVYRRVKAFNPKVVFSVTNHIPFGVLESSYGKKYTMKINDVCILETVDPYESECFNVHNSIEGNSYDYQSHTIGTLLRDHIPVYSSAAAKVDIGEFTVSFYPRKITLDLHCLLANLVVAYDEQNIKDILIENMNQKYPDPPIPEPDPGEPGEDDDPVFPEPDDKPSADGDYTPDENGFYHYYERCTETTPEALLVVEDAIPDNKYDPDTMIRQKDVLLDVPDISVGEFVLYCTGLNVDYLSV